MGDTYSIQEVISSAEGDINFGRQHQASTSQVVNTRTAKSIPIETVLLQQGLKKYYTHEEDWYHPLEGLNSSPLLLEDYYVDLHFGEMYRNGFIPGDSVKIEEVFLSKKMRNRNSMSILVIGEAGYGKSTLCKKFVHDWTKNSKHVSQFEIVILVRLRGVARTIEESVVKLCNEAMGTEYGQEQVLQYLRKLRDKLLLILDGYDEVNEETKTSLERILGYRQSGGESFLKLATVLMTSRPENELDESNVKRQTIAGKKIRSNVCQSFDIFLNIDELTDEARSAFIKKYFQDDEVKSDSLKSIILKSEIKLTRSPLLLHIMCYLHEHGSEVNAEENFWEQYMGLIFKRAINREVGGSSKLSEEKFHKLVLQSGKIFLLKKAQLTLYIEEKEIQEEFLDNAPFMMSCGLLQRVFTFKSDNLNLLEPPHKTLMDYLAKKHLTLTLDEAQKNGRLRDALLRVSLNTPYMSSSYNICTSLMSVVFETFFLYPVQFVFDMLKPDAAIEIRVVEEKWFRYAHDYFVSFDQCLSRDSAAELIIHIMSLIYPDANEVINRFKAILDVVGDVQSICKPYSFKFSISEACGAGFCEALKSNSIDSIEGVTVDNSFYISCIHQPLIFDRVYEGTECNVEQFWSALHAKPEGIIYFCMYHTLREDQLKEFLLREDMIDGGSSLELCYIRDDIHDQFVKDECNKKKLKNVRMKNIMDDSVVAVRFRKGSFKEIEEYYYRFYYSLVVLCFETSSFRSSHHSLAKPMCHNLI